MLKETISNITFYFIGLCWCEIQHLLVILDYVDICLWNIHPSIVKHFFYFCFFPENVPLIFYCTILWKKAMKHYYLYIFRGHRRRRIKCANNIFILFDIFMSHLPFSPCVFRIKIRFCQFSLQGKNKKAKWYCQTTKCFLIYNPYFINKD